MANPVSATTNFIGVDLSGRSLHAVLVGADGSVGERRQAPLVRDKITAQVAGIVAALREISPNVEAVGVGIPGLVNRDTDRVLVSSDLPSIVSGDVHSQLMQATGLRVELENDANAAAYGEFKVGVGNNHRDMFYITIGEGIGGALIMDSKLWIGASGCAGEIGHITIDTEGIECVCGNRGCLETVASAPNIVRRAKERLNRDSTSSLSRLAMKEAFTADDMAREATNGDDFSAMMIERTGKFIGTAVASVINLLSIELIVLGGGVMEAGEIILKPIIEEARRRAFQPCFEATKIVAATLGPDAVAIGAALLARDGVQSAGK
jgi:glucokinase